MAEKKEEKKEKEFIIPYSQLPKEFQILSKGKITGMKVMGITNEKGVVVTSIEMTR